MSWSGFLRLDISNFLLCWNKPLKKITSKKKVFCRKIADGQKKKDFFLDSLETTFYEKNYKKKLNYFFLMINSYQKGRSNKGTEIDLN